MSFVKKLFLIVIGLVPILFLPVIAAQATIFAPPKDFYVWQRSDRAVLVLEDKKQTLVLSPQVKGDLKNFAWIIPLPAEPEIKELKEGLFDSLTKITKKKIAPVNGEKNISSVPERTSTAEVIEKDDIELYETEIIQAETIEDITTYLSDNEFSLPEESNYLFEEYIELDWYFVFIEVKIAELEDFADSVSFEAYLPPIQLTFTTNNLFYPVKLLKIIDIQRPNEAEANEETAVEETAKEIVEGESDFSSSSFDQSQLPKSVTTDLFVLASHKKTIEDFETLYAGWITKKEISNLATDQDDAAWYKPKNDKLFLTQLSGSLELSSLSSDLLLRNASDDKTTVASSDRSSGYNWLWGILLFFITIIIVLISPIGLFFILGATIASLAKTRRARVLGWIFEIFAFLSLCLISILLIWAPYVIFSPRIVPDVYISPQNVSPNYNSYFILSAVVLSILGMLLTLILQIKKSRQKTKESKPEEKTIGDKIFDDKKGEKPSETETRDQGKEKEIELEEEPVKPKPQKHYTKKIKIDQQK